MSEARPESLGRIPSPTIVGASSRPWRRRLQWARGRVPRAVWIACGALLLVYTLYLLAVNVILQTGLLRGWLNTSPDKLNITYSSAWSPYPGRIVVRDFSLRFQDDNVQMLIELERGSMSIGLFELTKKTFHLERLEADGTVFRLRYKLAEAAGQEGRLAAYPPIPGFSDPPVRPPPPPHEIPEESYDLWTIHLEDVAASLRELWIMEYRYRGEGSVAGGMRLRPLRRLEVSPSVLLTRGGTLSIGDKDLLAGSDARLEARMDPFDVRVPQGAEVLRQLSARADMRGEVLSVEPLSSTYLAALPLALTGGRGHLDVRARVDRGIVHPETRVAWSSADLGVHHCDKALEARTTLGFVGRVEPRRPEDGPGATSLVAELHFDDAKLFDGREPLVVLADAKATVGTANDDLAAPFPLSNVQLDLPSAKAKDLRALASHFLPPNVRVTHGAAALALRGSYRDHSLDARADLALDRVELVAGTLALLASGKGQALATSRDVRNAITFGGSGLVLSDVAIRQKDARVDGLGVEVNVPEGLFRAQDARRGVDTELDVRVVPGDRVLRFGAALASLPKMLGDAPAGPEARAKLRLVLAGGAVDLRVLSARDGALSARGRLRKAKERPLAGAFLFEVGILRAGLEVAGGETKVHPFASKEWIEDKTR